MKLSKLNICLEVGENKPCNVNKCPSGGKFCKKVESLYKKLPKILRG